MVMITLTKKDYDDDSVYEFIKSMLKDSWTSLNI